MNRAIARALPILALGLMLGACAAPPGYWGGPGAPPASARYDWDALAAYQGQPRVDYPGPAIYGNTPDGGTLGGR